MGVEAFYQDQGVAGVAVTWRMDLQASACDIIEKQPKRSRDPATPEHRSAGIRRNQARSKRSAFMTLVHAATKSCTTFSLLSSWA
jgi:hypothetical protein